jgi:hypothetical protein
MLLSEDDKGDSIGTPPLLPSALLLLEGIGVETLVALESTLRSLSPLPLETGDDESPDAKRAALAEELF